MFHYIQKIASQNFSISDKTKYLSIFSYIFVVKINISYLLVDSIKDSIAFGKIQQVSFTVSQSILSFIRQYFRLVFHFWNILFLKRVRNLGFIVAKERAILRLPSSNTVRLKHYAFIERKEEKRSGLRKRIFEN